jgi:hypothetical protein
MNTPSWATSGSAHRIAAAAIQKVGVVQPLMKGMTDQPTLVPKLRDRLDGRAIHIEDPDAIGHLLNLP